MYSLRTNAVGILWIHLLAARLVIQNFKICIQERCEHFLHIVENEDSCYSMNFIYPLNILKVIMHNIY